MPEPAVSALELTVAEAASSACSIRPVIDIRENSERLVGIPRGAVAMTVEELLAQCRCAGDDSQPGGYLLCAEGVRSLDAVRRLRRAGFSGFLSVAGGFQAWRDAGLPVGYPEGFDSASAQRYARHLVMPQVGAEGQRKLLRTRILLAGLGGLNAPAALYLAAAGVGRLGLVDPDRVERSNLQRQVVHAESTLGRNKAVSAQARIRDLNPDIETVVIERRIEAENAAEVLAGWDIVIDGTDNFPARYALNEACVRLGVPLVYGAVMRFQGQVSVFWPARPAPSEASPDGPAPCFRCLFPQPPAAADAPGCAEAGVLGVLPGIVGTLQASEALKLALGIGQPLVGRLLMLDALNMEFRQARIAADPECPACAVRSSSR
jgi:molybdopterin/thiamine biosynthesis adenylyltransferase/rhodanese-related sulfurtransferase